MKKILFVIDKKGWAFDIITQDIISYLEFYKCSIVDEEEFLQMSVRSLREFHKILLWSWYFFDKAKKNIKKIDKNKLITGVFSYNSWQDKEKKLYEVLKNFDKVIYKNRDMGYRLEAVRNLYYIPALVNHKRFYPRMENVGGADGVNKDEERLVIGWTGNPDRGQGKWKGFWDILLPIVKKNKKKFTLEIATSYINFRPFLYMPEFYRNCDVVVCVSKGETDAQLLMEGAASGNALVSTKVGIASEIIKDGYSGILIDRDKNVLEKALLDLWENRYKCKEMGKRICETIEKERTYEKNMVYYQNLFK